MLQYLNKGVRTTSFWSPDAVPYSRGAWEFMAILNGEACQQYEGESKCRFMASRLYVSPPSSKHTWRVREGKSCEVIAMHFDKLPLQVQNIFSTPYSFSVPLSPKDVTRIEGIFTTVFPHYYKPVVESGLRYRQALLELCIIFLTNGKTSDTLGVDRSAERTQQAIQYFRDHLSRHLTIPDICKAMHISAPQLRRIFKQSLNQSPKQVFTNIALNEACRLALETPLLLKEISCRCGFAGFPQFYRAFRSQFGCAPEEWRRKHHFNGDAIAPQDKPPADLLPGAGTKKTDADFKVR